MSAQKDEAGEPREPVTIRLPSSDLRRFEREADAACMKRGTYLALKLLGEQPEPWPALVALARLIAIHQAVVANPSIGSEELRELRFLIREIARAAHLEATR